eukprot:CAMPEP_0184873772 /NCGR_PEP_ID=MMETSP0580-20130426/42024_1 /TAXON_ID=1118495 /ORGANISM="Dactyliosolen fragilissimus" /LENGTH=1462 /DNA_ID=CAMNT_0027376709 /DNA_START=173 /DNA_END=4561 /DNA_ORIENTATION=-
MLLLDSSTLGIPTSTSSTDSVSMVSLSSSPSSSRNEDDSNKVLSTVKQMADHSIHLFHLLIAKLISGDDRNISSSNKDNNNINDYYYNHNPQHQSNVNMKEIIEENIILETEIIHQGENAETKINTDATSIHTHMKRDNDVHDDDHDHDHDIKTATSTVNQRKHSSEAGKAADLGKRLLSMGDPSGAEAVCTGASSTMSDYITDNDVQQRIDAIELAICAAEAGLALHQRAWKSYVLASSSSTSSFTKQSSSSSSSSLAAIQKLLDAKHLFERAVRIDPTHPRSRTGLGLSLLLIGTRHNIPTTINNNNSYNDNNDQSNNDHYQYTNTQTQTRSSNALLDNSHHNQALNDAILHLDAAASLSSPNDIIYAAMKDKHHLTTKERDDIHLASKYNAAMARLALADASSTTISSLAHISTLLKQRILHDKYLDDAHTNDANTDTDTNLDTHTNSLPPHPDNITIVTLPDIHLSGAFLQNGNHEELLNNHAINVTARRFCKYSLDDNSNRMDDDDDDDDDDDNDDTSNNHNNMVRKRNALCASLLNNLAIAYESKLLESNIEPNCMNYDMAMEYELAILSSSQNLDAEGGGPVVSNRAQLIFNSNCTHIMVQDELESKLDDVHKQSSINTTDTKSSPISSNNDSFNGDDDDDDFENDDDDLDNNDDDDKSKNHKQTIVMTDHKKEQSFDLNNHNPPTLTYTNSNNKPIEKIALDALQRAVLVNPQEYDLWISLCRAKLRLGDGTGAVNAAANALDAAVNTSKKVDDTYEGNNAVAKATRMLEEALAFVSSGRRQSGSNNDNSDNKDDGDSSADQHSIKGKKYVAHSIDTTSQSISTPDSNSHNDGDEIRTLRLEKEVLSLRLELLRNEMNSFKSGHNVLNSMLTNPSNSETLTHNSDDMEKIPNESNLAADLSTDSNDDIAQQNEKFNLEPGVEEPFEEHVNEDTTDIPLSDEGSDFPTDMEAMLMDNTTATSDDTMKGETSYTHDTVMQKENDNTTYEEISKDNEAEITIEKSHHIEQEVKPFINSIDELVPDDQIELPKLYIPEESKADVLDATSQAYMKIADAYFQKQDYKRAVKQFLKILKKAPNDIQALLGYATSMEKTVTKAKQFEEVVDAYLNVTKVAAARGEMGLVEATLRRAMTVTMDRIEDDTAPVKEEGTKVKKLRFIAEFTNSYQIAADIYYQIGSQMASKLSAIRELMGKLKSSNESNGTEYEETMNFIREQAVRSLKITNALYTASNNSTVGDEGSVSKKLHSFHIKSVLQLGRIALDSYNDTSWVLDRISYIKDETMNDATFAESCLLMGDAYKEIGNSTGAIVQYRKVTDVARTDPYTGKAHYELGLLLTDEKEVESHLELALNLGMDLTPKTIEILGESNIAVMKSKTRAQWKEYRESLQPKGQGGDHRGGIMAGSGLSSESIFSSSSKETGDSNGVKSETLSLLEQGASAYDGQTVPTGEEVQKDAQV